MSIDNIEDLKIIEKDNCISYQLNDVKTNFIDKNDSFNLRILNLNPCFASKHLAKEIEVKNVLDRGFDFLNHEKYQKAVECFDEVIYYDSGYADALIGKSYALRGQGHFVKSLRYFKKASKLGFRDVEYQKELIRLANGERDNFPKLKLNIYAGDEYFSKKDFNMAVESYDKALANPSKFKDKILFKLINKKATALLKLKRYDEALKCFEKSCNVKPNDYALYGEGVCRYRLGEKILESFKRPLEITKSQALRQSAILNELGFFKESLAICDELFENHFCVDDFYFKLIEVKRDAMNKSGMDLTEINQLHDRIIK